MGMKTYLKAGIIPKNTPANVASMLKGFSAKKVSKNVKKK
jgi:hypothetical protein